MGNLNEPLVTVGIPFYNSEKYLSDAVKSTLNQTYTNLEIILLDDGSTDSSLTIAYKFEEKDKRVKVISDGKNLGLPKRLNQLSKLARGKYYARMDADDIMFSNRLSVQIKYLQNNHEVDLLGSGLIAINNNNDILGIRKGKASKNITLKRTLKGAWAAHPSITGKSEWFKKNHYDETLKRAQDFELWIRAVETSRFDVLDDVLLFYREASTSSMVKNIKASRYSIKTYWKNSGKTGFVFSISRICINLIKLFIYFSFFIFGATDVLIKRRSVKLSVSQIDKYQELLKKGLDA
ncbi:glycosyltransferase family 2 protein [Algibacter lectus]|uniref:Glycosyl transferase family 2 n=1 Tax=Algibacter lectus TaxID=221126 RepID=A0A4R8ME50_9FLAO|nr:glycosyltransferase family A protein [Algibacter lectus]MWW23655.1 glycosyltransferase [Algibacter lectus]TDY63664.1 glycosyl transferase family 2 [Algibacter lectus]